MLHVLALIIPLGLASAVSPVLLTEQTVVLASPGGKRSALAFAAGAVLTVSAFIAALMIFGNTTSLPKEPHLNAQLDIVVGVALAAFGLVLRSRRPKTAAEKPPRGPMNTRAAIALGSVSMATNFTTLALLIPAVKEISSSHLNAAQGAALALVLVALASLPAWLPLALTSIAPGPAERGLKTFGEFIQRSGRLATVVLLMAVGVFLIARGILRLAG